MPTTTTTTTIGTEVFWFLIVYDTDIPDANDSSMETQNPEKPEWQTEQISVPALEGQCYVKEKYPLLDLCYTELPCSRVVALCFCYPFGDCPTLGSCVKISDSNRCLECFSILSMINVKQAVPNGTVGCPVKIPVDDREVLKSF